VKVQLAAVTPSALNPEELTLIDPACGSGHILVEAYELFKAIYLERGYRQRDVAQLILKKNLFGLDIDGRAAQLAGFALMMKGRVDDRQLFERGVQPNVMALVDSTGFDAERLIQGVKLADYGLQPGDLMELKRLFEHATTFGSLIQVPEEMAAKLPVLKRLSEETSQDLFVLDALKRLGPLVQQAELLAAQYDVVVANPPYMGSGGMNGPLKKFTKYYFPEAKSDLFSCFIQRGYTLTKESRCYAMVTMRNWMFLSSFETMRLRMLREKTLHSMAQIGYNSFPSMNSKVAQAAVFSIRNCRVPGYRSTFTDLNAAPQSADKREVFLARDPANQFVIASDEFEKIPGSPIAFWVGEGVLQAFENPKLGEMFPVRSGLTSGDKPRFVRDWSECDIAATNFNARAGNIENGRWFPHNTGGPLRKWYGNRANVINWENDGQTLRSFGASTVRSSQYYFRSGITWTDVTSSYFSARYLEI